MNPTMMKIIPMKKKTITGGRRMLHIGFFNPTSGTNDLTSGLSGTARKTPSIKPISGKIIRTAPFA